MTVVLVKMILSKLCQFFANKTIQRETRRIQLRNIHTLFVCIMFIVMDKLSPTEKTNDVATMYVCKLNIRKRQTILFAK